MGVDLSISPPVKEDVRTITPLGIVFFRKVLRPSSMFLSPSPVAAPLCTSLYCVSLGHERCHPQTGVVMLHVSG